MVHTNSPTSDAVPKKEQKEGDRKGNACCAKKLDRVQVYRGFYGTATGMIWYIGHTLPVTGIALSPTPQNTSRTTTVRYQVLLTKSTTILQHE